MGLSSQLNKHLHLLQIKVNCLRLYQLIRPHNSWYNVIMWGDQVECRESYVGNIDYEMHPIIIRNSFRWTELSLFGTGSPILMRFSAKQNFLCTFTNELKNSNFIVIDIKLVSLDHITYLALARGIEYFHYFLCNLIKQESHHMSALVQISYRYGCKNNTNSYQNKKPISILLLFVTWQNNKMQMELHAYNNCMNLKSVLLAFDSIRLIGSQILNHC